MREPSSPIIDAAVVATLLAGGASRRMGIDKMALTLGTSTLLAAAAAALAPVAALRVQVGGGASETPGWPVIADAWPGAGPAAAIATALLHFPGAAIVVCAADMPFVPTALLATALARLPGHDAVAPRHGGRWHPLAGAYSPAILPAIVARLDRGDRSLQELLDAADVVPLEGKELAAWGDPERMLLNVNTPEDLQRARDWL